MLPWAFSSFSRPGVFKKGVLMEKIKKILNKAHDASSMEEILKAYIEFSDVIEKEHIDDDVFTSRLLNVQEATTAQVFIGLGGALVNVMDALEDLMTQKEQELEKTMQEYMLCDDELKKISIANHYNKTRSTLVIANYLNGILYYQSSEKASLDWSNSTSKLNKLLFQGKKIIISSIDEVEA